MLGKGLQMELSTISYLVDVIIVIGIIGMVMYVFVVWRLTKKLPGPTGRILASAKKAEGDLKEISKTLDQISTTLDVMRQNLQKLK